MKRPFLTIDETAAYLRVSTWTVRRRIADGDLKTEKVDDVAQVTGDSLQDYIARHTIPATRTPRSR